MKRISILLLTIAITLMAGTATIDAKKKASGKKSMAVYYLVINSNTTLSQAIEERDEHAADWVYTCPIYVAIDDDGVTRYRTIYGQYSSRAAANKDKIFLREYWGFSDAWIWKSNGHAKCVVAGGSYGP